MVQRVVAHDVPLVHHALHECGRGVDVIAHHEEAGGRVVFFERVQNGGRAAVFIARVKGQVDGLFARVAQIIGVPLAQFVCGHVARGRLAVRLEGQPPVADRGGGLRPGGGLGRGLLPLRQQKEQRGQQRADPGARADAV